MSQSLLGAVNQALVPSAIVIGIGALWRHFEPGGIDPREVRRVIGVLVLNLFYPAMILTVIPAVPLAVEVLAAPLWFALGALAVLALLAAARPALSVRLSPAQFAVLMLTSAYANIISLGIPVLQTRGGTDAARFAIYVDLLAVSPLFWLLGVWIASRGGSDGTSAGALGFVRTFLRLPPVWAFALAVTLNHCGLQLPAPLRMAAAGLGAATLPAMLLTVGMALSIRGVIHHRGVIALAAVLKLLVMPAIVFGGVELFGAPPAVRDSAVLLAATPTMMATLILSERFRLDTEMLAAILVATTALFFLTLPLWLWLLG